MKNDPNRWKVNLLLQVLLFFGGAGAGIGAWEGKTWLFEPTMQAPEILSVVPFRLWDRGKEVPILRVEAITDGVGKGVLRVIWKRSDGSIKQEDLVGRGLASHWVFDLRRDKTLEYVPSGLPPWILKMKFFSLRADADPYSHASYKEAKNKGVDR